jgi:HEAT repeat protein
MTRPSRWNWLVTVLALTLAGPAVAQQQNESPTEQTRTSARQLLEQAHARAIDEVLAAARGDSAELRMNAIEAIQPVPDRALPLAELGLADDNPAVRFAALSTVGKLQLDSLAPRARELAQNEDQDPSVRAAAMFAAHQCGLDIDISPLAGLLKSEDPTVRGNVAMLLREMGNPSAIPMLEEVAEDNLPKANPARETVVRVQVAEALVELGQEEALDPLRAAMYSSYMEARVLAVTVLGKLGDEKMVPALQEMLDHPPIELQLAAAKALARLGHDRGPEVLMRGARMSEADVGRRAKRFLAEQNRADVGPRFKQLVDDGSLRQRVAANLRAQAAFGLAASGQRQAAEELVSLLDDEVARVRLAAAAAILERVGESGAHSVAPPQEGG